MLCIVLTNTWKPCLSSETKKMEKYRHTGSRKLQKKINIKKRTHFGGLGVSMDRILQIRCVDKAMRDIPSVYIVGIYRDVVYMN